MTLGAETLAIISLLALFLTIAIAFWRKLNPGVLAFGVTLILAIIANIPTHTIIKGFNSNLFIILLGASFFASIAQINGTLHLLARKVVAMAGKRAWAVPFFMYFVGVLLAASGPGTVPGIALATMFAAPLALTMGAHPLLMCYPGQLGAIAGGMVPWCATGIVSNTLSADIGYPETWLANLFVHLVATFIFAVYVYILFRGWRLTKSAEHEKESDIPPFNRDQRLTLIAAVVMIFIVIVFKTNIGLTCFVIGCILNLLGVTSMEDCIKKVSWGVILMVVGVGMLMHLVIIAGGIDLLAKIMASISSADTIDGVISIVAGCMSWFSSTSGVVMPALIPTVPSLMEHMGLTDPNFAVAMIASLGVGSHLAGLSPASTGGALTFAHSTGEFRDKIDHNKLFLQMFAISVSSVLLSGVVAVSGLSEFITSIFY